MYLSRFRPVSRIAKEVELEHKMEVDVSKGSSLYAARMKYISLVTLSLQNGLVVISARHYRSRPGDTAVASSVILATEVMKLIGSLLLVYKDETGVVALLRCIKIHIWNNPRDTLRVSVPAFVYLCQNNLLYLATSHLDAPTFHVSYQLKIFTTAMFSVLILNRQLRLGQWASFALLLYGIVLVQLAQGGVRTPNPKESWGIGMSAAIGAAICSGFAGVYFENILKSSEVSVWIRNVQLSLLSIVIALFSCYFGNDSELVWSKGLFFGYNGFIFYLILLQSGGGLLVGLVVKYADNILKSFALCLSIILSALFSAIFLNFQLNGEFAVGTLLVIVSIFLYSWQPPCSRDSQRPAVGSVKALK